MSRVPFDHNCVLLSNKSSRKCFGVICLFLTQTALSGCHRVSFVVVSHWLGTQDLEIMKNMLTTPWRPSGTGGHLLEVQNLRAASGGMTPST